LHHLLRQQAPVRQRELEVAGDQDGVEAVAVDDDADGMNGRHPAARQLTQYPVLAFGEPLRFRDLPGAQQLTGLSEEARRELARRIAGQLMERIATSIPATPVPLLAAVLLDGGGTETELAARVRALREKLSARGVPVALGAEFEHLRRGRAALEEDEDRNRDLLRLEGELLASEEDEAIVRLGAEHLERRGVIALRDGAVAVDPSPRAQELLDYYARSLAVPD